MRTNNRSGGQAKEQKASVPVWVNGLRYDIDTAAERLSLLFGYKVAKWQVYALVKDEESITVNGVRISGSPLAAEKAAPTKRRNRPAEAAKTAPKAKRAVSTTKRAAPAAARERPVAPRPQLLRYPKGEAPVDRGAPHAGS
jgi:hypothetical protein